MRAHKPGAPAFRLLWDVARSPRALLVSSSTGDERKSKAKDEQLQKGIGNRKSWTLRERDERSNVKCDREKEPPVR